jgi:hypothetical protein
MRFSTISFTLPGRRFIMKHRKRKNVPLWNIFAFLIEWQHFPADNGGSTSAELNTKGGRLK